MHLTWTFPFGHSKGSTKIELQGIHASDDLHFLHRHHQTRVWGAGTPDASFKIPHQEAQAFFVAEHGNAIFSPLRSKAVEVILQLSSPASSILVAQVVTCFQGTAELPLVRQEEDVLSAEGNTHSYFRDSAELRDFIGPALTRTAAAFHYKEGFFFLKKKHFESRVE